MATMKHYGYIAAKACRKGFQHIQRKGKAMTASKWFKRIVVAAALPLAMTQAYAQEKGKHPASGAELQYQAGSSPLAGVDMYQDINPKAPAMSKERSRLG